MRRGVKGRALKPHLRYGQCTGSWLMTGFPRVSLPDAPLRSTAPPFM
jgi:hypothetical protein